MNHFVVGVHTYIVMSEYVELLRGNINWHVMCSNSFYRTKNKNHFMQFEMVCIFCIPVCPQGLNT